MKKSTIIGIGTPYFLSIFLFCAMLTMPGLAIVGMVLLLPISIFISGITAGKNQMKLLITGLPPATIGFAITGFTLPYFFYYFIAYLFGYVIGKSFSIK
ncbi:MAG: hypothetical protein ACRCWG_16665 [Sarcina sp.]